MVVLTHGYFIDEDAAEQQIMKPYPPLGILYLSSFLEEQGIANEVFDSTFSSFNELSNYLISNSPLVLGIYVNLVTKLNVVKLLRFVNTHQALKKVKVVLGGPDVRYNKEAYLKLGANYIVLGEGEETFGELVAAIIRQDKVDHIPGISFLDKGKVFTNPERPLNKELDKLPFPNRKKIDLAKYLATWKQYHGYSSITISTMRGCPYTCKWCSRGVYGKSYRRRTPANVVEELEYIAQQYNPDNIWFVDDVFTISHKWLVEFATIVKEKNLNIKYECITRADRMNDEVIKLLKQSGCYRVWIGAESGSQNIIDLMDRRVDVDLVQQMIRAAKQNDIEAGTFIMLGYPEETEQDIKQTLKHLKKANPTFYTITITYPIRGTELFQQVEASSNVADLDFATTTDRQIAFKQTFSKKYYQYAIQWINSEMTFLQRKERDLAWHDSLKAKLKSVKARIGMYLEKRKLVA
ncbi:B12-binding domain-containing radical SAM protein [Nubsella zeaxanthinifaciens]|uniref:B12-binding domain-containing radical SAM protein n=1 Tax=Nubsella zeaxanthinifaciens TaxID=392412 RepID=UPI000DE4290B|nr:radical SAM protein [Nubsella zeaxanthinifaciens]